MDPENGSTEMTEQTALEIARSATLKPITDVAALMGIGPDLLEPYGEFVTKIKLDAISALNERPIAKYILVTAVTPTPFGEGKTTTTIGLAQGMHHLGRTATAAIHQPSMGPTFGIKGGGAGGGYSKAAPFEAINLHLTGDMHVVTAAHNTLAAMVDNHLFHGNELGIDIDSVTWQRVLDVTTGDVTGISFSNVPKPTLAFSGANIAVLGGLGMMLILLGGLVLRLQLRQRRQI